MMGIDRSFRLWPALTLLVLAWLSLSWPWLSAQVTVPWDAKAHFQAQFQFLADSLHRGESPFWNPYIFAGSPQIADPQSLIFSPPHLLAALVTPTPSFQLSDGIALGMLLAGGIAILLLFKDRGWHWIGGLVAAIAFAFGGSAAWRIQHTGQVLSLAWFPIAFWCLQRALERSSAGWGLAAGLTAGFMVLGRDQVALLGTYALIAFVITHCLSHGLSGLRKALRPLGAGLFAGLLVTALPLVMTALLADQTSRAAIIDLDGAGRGSLHPASLLTLFVANLYGTDGPLVDFWGQPSFAWGPTDLYLARNMSDLYMGAIPLLGLLAAGLSKGGFAAREIRFVLIATLAMLIYALGRYTPAFAPLFNLVPGVSLFRRPADATFVFGAMAAILAGYGIHRLLTTPEPSNRRSILAFILIAAGFVASIGVALWKTRLGQAFPHIAMAAVTMVVSGLVLWAAPRLVSVAPILTGTLVAATLTADLRLHNGPNESTALPPALYDVLRPDSSNAMVAALKARLPKGPDRRDRVELAGIDFHWPNASMVHRLDNTLGYNPVHLNDYSRATGAQDHVALPDQRTFAPAMPGYRSMLSDLLGLRLIATRGTLDAVDRSPDARNFAEVARTPEGRIYENTGALPRVLFASSALGVSFEEIIRSGQWPDFDPRSTVLLDEPARPLEPAGAASGRVTIQRYENTEIRLEATSPVPGYVVLHDVWHPWWFAEVDGQPAEMLKANLLFRAVKVPSGTHQIRYRFDPLRGVGAELSARWSALRAGSSRH